MIGTLPFTYIFFLLPLLSLPLVLLATLTLIGVIKNPTAIKIIQVLAVVGALLALWLVGILIRYLVT
jgi:hypothetical protein